jgi:hypothetical protein
MKKKIATITTKFDLVEPWKSDANYSHFLERNNKKWVEVLKGVTKDEIQGFLDEKGLELQESLIDIKIKSRPGCWEMVGDVFIQGIQAFTTVYTIIDIIRKNKEDLEERLKGSFADGLNEEVEKFEIQKFDIDPVDVNEQEYE